jgi:hypothetical protein
MTTSSSAPDSGWRTLTRLGKVTGVVLAVIALGLYTYYAGVLVQVLRHL